MKYTYEIILPELFNLNLIKPLHQTSGLQEIQRIKLYTTIKQLFKNYDYRKTYKITALLNCYLQTVNVLWKKVRTGLDINK